jgi:hypothetical protein
MWNHNKEVKTCSQRDNHQMEKINLFDEASSMIICS